jgi:hypothetical protein
MTMEVLGSVFNRVAIHIPGRRRLRLLVSVVMMARTLRRVVLSSSVISETIWKAGLGSGSGLCTVVN